MDRFWPNLHNYIVDMKKNGLVFGDLDSIFKVTGELRLMEMAFLHPISRMNGWILTKLVQLYCWGRDKNWLDFGDLDTIFKVTVGGGGLRLLENGLSAPYLQNVYLYCCDMEKEKNWLDFGDLDPIFKVLDCW